MTDTFFVFWLLYPKNCICSMRSEYSLIYWNHFSSNVSLFYIIITTENVLLLPLNKILWLNTVRFSVILHDTKLSQTTRQLHLFLGCQSIHVPITGVRSRWTSTMHLYDIYNKRMWLFHNSRYTRFFLRYHMFSCEYQSAGSANI